ncbi:MAG: hypothetical protein MHMPM18_000454 [Marteilia pararefringens]
MFAKNFAQPSSNHWTYYSSFRRTQAEEKMANRNKLAPTQTLIDFDTNDHNQAYRAENNVSQNSAVNRDTNSEFQTSAIAKRQDITKTVPYWFSSRFSQSFIEGSEKVEGDTLDRRFSMVSSQNGDSRNQRFGSVSQYSTIKPSYNKMPIDPLFSFKGQSIGTMEAGSGERKLRNNNRTNYEEMLKDLEYRMEYDLINKGIST